MIKSRNTLIHIHFATAYSCWRLSSQGVKKIQAMESQEFFEAKFMSAAGPLFYMCRFFGLAPFDRRFKTLKIWCIYSALIGASAVFAFANKLQRLGNNQGRMRSQDFSTSILLSLVTNTCAIAMVLSSFARKTDYGNIVKKICELDIIFGRDPQTYHYVNLFLRKEISMFSIFLLAMTFSDYLYTYISKLQWWEQISHAVYMVTLVAPLIFLNLVYLLKTRFSSLNNLLENIGRSSLRSKNLRLCHDNLFLECHHSETLSINLNNHKDSFLPRASNQIPQEKKVELVNNLRKIHFKLYNIVAMSNHAFGLRNLILLLCYLVTIASGTYLVMEENFANIVKTSNVHHWSSDIIWLILVCLILVSMSILCNLTAEEANRTAVLVRHHLLFKKGIGNAEEKELWDFAHQLSGYRIAFTAAGVIEINNTLLLSVTATVASYIVVLLSVK